MHPTALQSVAQASTLWAFTSCKRLDEESPTRLQNVGGFGGEHLFLALRNDWRNTVEKRAIKAQQLLIACD